MNAAWVEFSLTKKYSYALCYSFHSLLQNIFYIISSLVHVFIGLPQCCYDILFSFRSPEYALLMAKHNLMDRMGRSRKKKQQALNGEVSIH